MVGDLGAEKLNAIDPIYKGDVGNSRKDHFGRSPVEVLQRVNFIPESISTHAARAEKYPVILAFQAFADNCRTFANSIAKLMMDDGVVLIMTDQAGIDHMPKDVLKTVFNDVQLCKCAEGRYMEDEFFLGDLNRFAFICRGPKINIEQARGSSR